MARGVPKAGVEFFEVSSRDDFLRFFSLEVPFLPRRRGLEDFRSFFSSLVGMVFGDPGGLAFAGRAGRGVFGGPPDDGGVGMVFGGAVLYILRLQVFKVQRARCC